MTGIRFRMGNRRGQSAVEFALLLPILLLVMMGGFDFSVAVGRAAQLTAAVQEGAAYARRSPSDAATIRTHVKQEGPGLNLADADILITCFSGLSTTTLVCGSATFGDSVRVQATYRYVPITGRLIAITGSPLAITQTATIEIY